VSENDQGSFLPEKNELYCFLTRDRVCGADCMAYQTMPDVNQHLDGDQPHCLLVNSAERMGRGISVLAAVFGNWMRDTQRREADAKREAASVIPSQKPGVGKL
jgi:hypothetical protein